MAVHMEVAGVSFSRACARLAGIFASLACVSDEAGLARLTVETDGGVGAVLRKADNFSKV